MFKKIISNTLLFIGIILFVFIFKSIFGDSNNLVGVSTVVCLLVSLSTNMTKQPLKNFFLYLTINILLGIFSYVANYHIYIGILLNFVVLASIGYFFSFNLSKSLIVPLGLEYLFMLYSPVSGSDFVLRLCGLAVGPVIVILVQLLMHSKNKKVVTEESEIVEYKDIDNSEYFTVSIFGKEFVIHSLRAKYALRIGILAAITTFIESLLLKYFNLIEGKWLVYTIFSLTELYSDNCRIKSKQRLQGTIIGAVIILILFIIFKDPTIRGLIILVTGYLNTYVSNYKDSIIIVTITAIATTALATGTLIAIVERISFVCIGIVIALIGNKFLFNSEKKVA